MTWKCRIQNEHGQWYKGDGEWVAVPEAAEVYDSIYNLPDTITGADGKPYLLHVGWVPKSGDMDTDPSVAYYPDELDTDLVYAMVRW